MTECQHSGGLSALQVHHLRGLDFFQEVVVVQIDPPQRIARRKGPVLPQLMGSGALHSRPAPISCDLSVRFLWTCCAKLTEFKNPMGRT